MTKLSLEPFHNAHTDLFYWIKQYLASKMFALNVTDGWEISFNRAASSDRIIAANDDNDLDVITKEIRYNGMKNIGIYATALITYYRYVKTDKKIESIKEINTAYRDAYFAKNPGKVKSGTLKSYFTQVNSLFKYIEANAIDEETGEAYNFNLGRTRSGQRTTTPIADEEREPTYLEPEEFKRFIKALELYKFRGENAAQGRLLMKVIAYGGLRADEAVSLKVNDLALVKDPSVILSSGEYLRINLLGKGKKLRTVYIRSDFIKKDYTDHMKHRNCSGDYLFCGQSGYKYTSRDAYDLSRRILKEANVTKTGTHALRRSFATFLMVQKVDYAEISELLGHEGEEMTELYVQITKDGLREIVKFWDEI